METVHSGTFYKIARQIFVGNRQYFYIILISRDKTNSKSTGEHILTFMADKQLVLIFFHLLKINPLQVLCHYLFGLAGYLAVAAPAFSYREAGLIFVFILSGQAVYSCTRILFPTRSLFAPPDRSAPGELNRLIILGILFLFAIIFLYSGPHILPLSVSFHLGLLVGIIAVGMLGEAGILHPYLKGGLAGLAPLAGLFAGGATLSTPSYLLWLATGFWWAGLVIYSLQLGNKNLILNPSGAQKKFWDRVEKILIIFNFTVALLGWLAFGRQIDADVLFYSIVVIFFAGSIFALQTTGAGEEVEEPGRRAASIMSAGFFLAVLLDFLVII